MFHSGQNFFGQPPENRAAIHDELYNMPVPLRRYYAQQLIKAKERERKAYEKASNNSEEQISRPAFQKS